MRFIYTGLDNVFREAVKRRLLGYIKYTFKAFFMYSKMLGIFFSLPFHTLGMVFILQRKMSSSVLQGGKVAGDCEVQAVQGCSQGCIEVRCIETKAVDWAAGGRRQGEGL